MTSRFALGLIVLACLATTRTLAGPPAQTRGAAAPSPADAALIASAMSAAPAAVSRNATVVAMNDKMEMRTLRAGTSGWTCMPDVPNTPGPDPMCVDKNGMDWVMALVGHKDPPHEKMALAYMLAGGSDASNTDPWATKPAAGDQWVKTGPHMMVMNVGAHFDGYPTTAASTAVPYVMYANTPYAHLMIPVK
jgi:hypothetical protein